MTTASFDLTDAPWIPCETPTGELVELGLRETLSRAHELRALADPSPLVTAALHRLLLAIVHRVFGPASVDAWCALYKAGRFDAEAVGAYLSQWRHRFDLLHPERPFYQVRGLPDADDNVAMLVAERSAWGVAASVFEHRPSDWADTFSFAEAARGLVTYHAYAAAGLVRKPGEPTAATSGPLQRGVVAIVQGTTLFETLLLNLLVYSGEHPIPAADDAPAWERESLPRELPLTSEPRRLPTGWLDLLTWQSRRIELKHDGARVTGLIRRVGQGLADGSPHDPMMSWRAHEKFGWVPFAFNPDRVFWRDSHALFAPRNRPDVERPRTVTQLGLRPVQKCVEPHRRLAVGYYGLTPDKASILLVRAEHLPVSPRLLADEDLGESFVEALGVVEKIAGALQGATWLLGRHAIAPGAREPASADVRNLVDDLASTRRYWTALKAHFEQFIRTIADDERAAGRTFLEAACREARESLRTSARALGTSARALKARSYAEQKLAIELSDVIPERYRPEPKEQTS